MEQTLDNQRPDHKIYNDNAMWFGSFIGGPLAAGYIIAENFKAFNQPEKAKKTWIYTIIATVVIFGGIFLINDNFKFPNSIIPLIYTGIAYYLLQHFQGANIRAHINAGGQVYNWWRVLCISLLSFTIIAIAIFSVVFLTDNSALSETSKTYGKMKYEIAFEKNNIKEAEFDKIADGLTKTNFFDEEYRIYIF